MRVWRCRHEKKLIEAKMAVGNSLATIAVIGAYQAGKAVVKKCWVWDVGSRKMIPSLIDSGVFILFYIIVVVLKIHWEKN
jgi:hypothetical protein